VKAPQSARLALKKGYKNIYLYQDGLEGWGKKGFEFSVIEKIPQLEIRNLSPADVKAQIEKDKNILLVDIRDDDLYETIRFKGGEVLHLRMVDLLDKKDSIPMDRNLLIVDQLGKQVIPASSLIKNWGFKVIGSLDGGIMAWQKAGMPVELRKGQ
jgi:rhodanese-related sulfurtransferase